MQRRYTLKIEKSGKMSCEAFSRNDKAEQSSRRVGQLPRGLLRSLKAAVDSESFKGLPEQLAERRGIDYFSTKIFLVTDGGTRKRVVAKNYFPTVAPNLYPASFRAFTRILSKAKETAFED